VYSKDGGDRVRVLEVDEKNVEVVEKAGGGGDEEK